LLCQANKKWGKEKGTVPFSFFFTVPQAAKNIAILEILKNKTVLFFCSKLTSRTALSFARGGGRLRDGGFGPPPWQAGCGAPLCPLA